MNDLTLHPGPQLTTIRSQEDAEGRRRPVKVDVTSRAHEFLFDTVTVAEGVTLADIFGLLNACPELVGIYRRHFSKELLAHANKGLSPKYVPGYDPEGIEYLELYQVWNFNTATKTYQPVGRLSFHGIGFELREDRDMGGYVEKAGSRVQWGVSLSDIRELLSLPIRIRQDIPVCEDDFSAKAWGKTLDTVRVEAVTLGEVLHGVLWELSFHGAPSEQEEFREQLQTQVEEIRSGTAELVDGSDIFDDWDRPAIEKLFDTIGSQSIGDVTHAMRELEDDEPIQAGLQARFADEVRVKAEHATLPARAFRRLFSAVKCED